VSHQLSREMESCVDECLRYCERLGGMEDCVAACRRCAESCRKMAA
jgi:hypothetical protein